MNKAELESKHIAELHALAAEAGVPKYRMLRREELIEKLSDGEGGSRSAKKPASSRGRERDRGGERDRSQRRRRERDGDRQRRPRERPERPPREERPKPAATPPEPQPAAAQPAEPASASEPPSSRPKRRRRRRFGRRGKGLRVQDLLTPPPGRQSLVYAESREACTALLREIAAELADGSIALLVDPSPEELAEWKREAPQSELVVAAQARHASDAVAQAARRAESGEHVTLLVDSLTRLEDADVAREVFDGGLALRGNGSLTVVAALERAA